MPKTIYVQFLSEQPNSNPHYLNRLIKLLNHFISIEPKDKPKGFECHHIVPKSWKSEWSKEPGNLLKIPIKAHYVIHHLMWKAFPKDYAMIQSFNRISDRLKEKITAKVFEIMRTNFSKVQSENNLKRVASGTHNLLGGKIQSKEVQKRIANRSFHLLDGEIQRKSNAERVKNGTHHFLGPESNRKRLANGTHNLSNLVKKQLENGSHNTQIKKTCPHCGKICSIPLFGRWHGDRCKTQSSKGASK